MKHHWNVPATVVTGPEPCALFPFQLLLGEELALDSSQLAGASLPSSWFLPALFLPGFHVPPHCPRCCWIPTGSTEPQLLFLSPSFLSLLPTPWIKCWNQTSHLECCWHFTHRGQENCEEMGNSPLSRHLPGMTQWESIVRTFQSPCPLHPFSSVHLSIPRPCFYTFSFAFLLLVPFLCSLSLSTFLPLTLCISAYWLVVFFLPIFSLPLLLVSYSLPHITVIWLPGFV